LASKRTNGSGKHGGAVRWAILGVAWLAVILAGIRVCQAQPPDELEETEVTRWIDPTGRQPMTYEEWLATQPPHRSAIEMAPPPAPTPPTETGAIRILIRDTIYPSLTTAIGQYVDDLTAQGYSVLTRVGDFATPAELRAWLQGEYANSQILGAVIIGDWPVPWYEMDDDFVDQHAEFPCDLYFMDLDGLWSDGDADGLFDSHAAGSGDVGLEIWVGRLTFSPLAYTGATETELLNAYFDKNHRYRTGQLCQNAEALAYIDDEWDHYDTCGEIDLCLTYEAGDVTLVTDPETTTTEDFKTRFIENREFIHVMSHGSPGGHVFYRNSQQDVEWVFVSDVVHLDPQAHFYNLFICSGSRYVETDYIGGWYINTSKGLAAVGSTKTGSMLTFPEFYAPLSTGATIGEAFKTWFDGRAAGGFDLGERRWFYGMTVLGDPTLGPKASAPDPYETNNSCATAYNLGTVTTQFSSEVAHFDDADQDWYAFDIGAQGTIVIDTTLYGTNANTVISLYETCGGGPLATNDDYAGLASHIEVQGAAGTYYLLIDPSGQDYGTCRDYSFTIALLHQTTAATFRIDASGNLFADGAAHATSFQSGSADVAEWVPVSEPVEPGDVVELDPLNPGSYRPCTDPCSGRLAGVISTEPGMILGGSEASTERAVLALIGIVPVKATDEGGPIGVGDLLVTSSTPGHAMRWSGAGPCPCALVGKALEPLDGDSGVILVLLTAH
jgi:hypothetical protein